MRLPIAADLDGLTTIVDKASQSSDRWLFLFVLGLMLAGGLAIIRYLTRALEKQATEHSEFVLKVYTENVKLTAQLLVALQENNILITRMKIVLENMERENKV